MIETPMHFSQHNPGRSLPILWRILPPPTRLLDHWLGHLVATSTVVIVPQEDNQTGPNEAGHRTSHKVSVNIPAKHATIPPHS
ncbi:hypothetical protein DL93DRAFT_2075689 [Clavulina sp. PMI_390]|nr:hypothetical protein DL93DRAFT_2075689 [Clavulina sp. PMI_390]